MYKKKVLAMIVLISFFTFMVSQPVSLTNAKPKDAISVACVFATGGLGDKSFNDMAKAGLDKAESEGLCTFDYSEPDEIAEYEGMMESYASAGTHDLIIAIGFDQATAVNETALAYPEQPIILIDMVVFQGNVRSVVFNVAEGSFLVGAMASICTQTGKLGFIGGMDIPLIREFWAGFAAGVYYENSSYTVSESFVGDWGDPTTAKSLAEAMWADGVDIIFSAAGSSGLGVLESAGEQSQGKFAIGVDADQDYLYEERILCSMMKRVDVAVYNAIKDVSDDTWTSGIISMGLEDNGVGISPLTYTKDIIGTNNINEVNVTVRNKIVDGTIVPPINSTELTTWKNLNLSSTYVPEALVFPASGIPGFEFYMALCAFIALPIFLKKRR